MWWRRDFGSSRTRQRRRYSGREGKIPHSGAAVPSSEEALGWKCQSGVDLFPSGYNPYFVTGQLSGS